MRITPRYLTSKSRKCWCGWPAMFLSRLCRKHWLEVTRGN
jgi:hypothetical protein